MELKNDTTALLDRTIVYDVKITAIRNEENLMRRGILTKRILLSGECVNCIRIDDDDYINSFVYGINAQGLPYGTLDVSVQQDEWHNLNCVAANDYGSVLANAKSRLENTYGIITDFSDCKFKSLEINKTIVLNGNFNDYHRVFVMMMHCLPAKLKMKNSQEYNKHSGRVKKASETKKVIESYSRSSGEKGIEVKIYDKTSQLQECFGIHVNHNYMRYEITLQSPKKIKDVFKDNKVSTFTNEMIQDYFNSFVEQNLCVPFEEFKKKREAIIKSMLVDNYKSSQYGWLNITVLQLLNKEVESKIAVALDADEILSQMENVKFTSRQNKSMAKKRLISICETKAPVFSNGDGDKYIEVMTKLKNTQC